MCYNVGECVILVDLEVLFCVNYLDFFFMFVVGFVFIMVDGLKLFKGIFVVIVCIWVGNRVFLVLSCYYC